MRALPTRGVALAALLLLAGCASTITGTGSGASGHRSGAPSTAGVSTTPAAAFPTTIGALGDRLLTGNASISSAHLELFENTGGVTVRGIGDETLSDGEVTGLDLTETVGALTLRFIGLGQTFYAKLPPEVYQSHKPWVLLGPNTTDPKLKSIYTSFQTSLQNSAGKTIKTLVSASSSLHLVGTEQLDGTTVGHYQLTVDVTKLPADFTGKNSLVQAGVTSIPLELYVDGQGRTRKTTERLTVSSTTVDVQITLTRIDAPVTVTPPPASEVGTS